MQGRDHVIPEDVQTMLAGVVAHRLRVYETSNHQTGFDPVQHLVESVVIP